MHEVAPPIAVPRRLRAWIRPEVRCPGVLQARIQEHPLRLHATVPKEELPATEAVLGSVVPGKELKVDVRGNADLFTPALAVGVGSCAVRMTCGWHRVEHPARGLNRTQAHRLAWPEPRASVRGGALLQAGLARVIQDRGLAWGQAWQRRPLRLQGVSEPVQLALWREVLMSTRQEARSFRLRWVYAGVPRQADWSWDGSRLRARLRPTASASAVETGYLGVFDRVQAGKPVVVWVEA